MKGNNNIFYLFQRDWKRKTRGLWIPGKIKLSDYWLFLCVLWHAYLQLIKTEIACVYTELTFILCKRNPLRRLSVKRMRLRTNELLNLQRFDFYHFVSAINKFGYIFITHMKPLIFIWVRIKLGTSYIL